MLWWQILIALLDLYVLVTLAPWIALEILQAALLGDGRYLQDEHEQLARLEEAQRRQLAVWPQTPRPGRFEQLDRHAREEIIRLHDLIEQARQLLAQLASYGRIKLTVVQVLTLRAWPPLTESLNTLSDLRTLRRRLDQAEVVLSGLLEAEAAAQNIPNRVEAALQESRAEVRRLSALLEAEQAAGTAGLGDLREALIRRESEIETALEDLAAAHQETVPAVVQRVDGMLQSVAPAIAETDERVTAAAETRKRAEDVNQRIASSVRASRERWEGLQGRGVAASVLTARIEDVEERSGELTIILQDRTCDAYREVIERSEALDAEIEALNREMAEMDELMEQSRAAIAGDVKVLAEAQQLCDALSKRDPLLEPDQSLALIEKATEAYLEAEQQHNLGTPRGFEAAIALSERAVNYLDEAKTRIEPLADLAEEVRELLAALNADILGDWRSRVERVREQLRLYARHWDTGPAGDAAEAISNLDQVEIDLERMSPNVRYQRRFAASELIEAQEILEHALARMERTKELVVGLENEYERIESKRAEFEEALEQILERTLPSLERLSDEMLPELAQRVMQVRSEIQARLVVLEDPAEVNYDEVTDQWLPHILGQLEDIRTTHSEDVQYYMRLLQESQHRIERQWVRLERQNPLQPPLPDEDIDTLQADLDAWRKAVQTQEKSPIALRDLVGREAAALEQRIEVARNQVTEGRRTMDALSRQYNRRIQAARTVRSRVMTLQGASQWPHLAWDLEEAERAWERALALERDSRSGTTLSEVNNQLEQAINMAQQTEQSYATLEHTMSNALSRLDDELRSVETSLARGEHRLEMMREGEASSEDLSTVEAICASTQRAVELARASSSFEDALRYLRQARNTLSRV